MCNEGELLEKFNIQLSPIPLPELIAEVRRIRDNNLAKEELDVLHDKTVIKISEPKVSTVAALAKAMKNLIEKYGCQAGAIQC